MKLPQGAEAIVKQVGTTLVKQRAPKSYRHPVLDSKLKKARSRQEKRLLEKAAQVILVPKVLSGDDETVVMEFLKGEQVKEVLEENISLCEDIGSMLAKLHEKDIIHGDLTTSNMIFTSDKKIYFIDFGLAFTSTRVEDKAVDIHLFKQALESKHHTIVQKAYKLFLKGYKSYSNQEQVLQRLKAVEKRGRNKDA